MGGERSSLDAGTRGTIRGEEVLLKGEDGVNVYTLRSEAVKASPCTRLPDAGARLSPPSRMLLYPVYVFVHECAYVRASVCRGAEGAQTSKLTNSKERPKDMDLAVPIKGPI